MREKLKELLMKDEGLSLKPYQCPSGRSSIGYGRNLQDNGISEQEADYLLENDINETLRQANRLNWFSDLDEARRVVVASMIFNMGLSRFLEFKKLIRALEDQDFNTASHEMLSSLWASQVKRRAVDLAVIMKSGQL